MQQGPIPERDEGEEYTVVKTKKFVVKPMDTQEAIMQMNLLNHNFFMFRDSETESVNVVYHRVGCLIREYVIFAGAAVAAPFA